jgi:undecaprenyl-diphosphatase
MRRAEAVLAGLVQGPAELLPVSSSAHVGLLIARRHPGLRGAERKELEVALHAGTALALAVGERRRPRVALLAAATLPPAVIGFALERAIESRLGTPASIAAGLLAGSAAMVAADRTPARRAAGGAGAGDGAWLAGADSGFFAAVFRQTASVGLQSSSTGLAAPAGTLAAPSAATAQARAIGRRRRRNRCMAGMTFAIWGPHRHPRGFL